MLLPLRTFSLVNCKQKLVGEMMKKLKQDLENVHKL